MKFPNIRMKIPFDRGDKEESGSGRDWNRVREDIRRILANLLKIVLFILSLVPYILKSIIKVMSSVKVSLGPMETMVVYDDMHSAIFRVSMPQKVLREHLHRSCRFIPTPGSSKLNGMLLGGFALAFGFGTFILSVISIQIIMGYPFFVAAISAFMLAIIGGVVGSIVGFVYSKSRKPLPVWIVYRDSAGVISSFDWNTFHSLNDLLPGYVYEYMQMRDEMNLMKGDPMVMQKVMIGAMIAFACVALFALYMFWTEFNRLEGTRRPPPDTLPPIEEIFEPELEFDGNDVFVE